MMIEGWEIGKVDQRCRHVKLETIQYFLLFHPLSCAASTLLFVFLCVLGLVFYSLHACILSGHIHESSTFMVRVTFV